MSSCTEMQVKLPEAKADVLQQPSDSEDAVLVEPPDPDEAPTFVPPAADVAGVNLSIESFAGEKLAQPIITTDLGDGDYVLSLDDTPHEGDWELVGEDDESVQAPTDKTVAAGEVLKVVEKPDGSIGFSLVEQAPKVPDSSVKVRTPEPKDGDQNADGDLDLDDDGDFELPGLEDTEIPEDD